MQFGPIDLKAGEIFKGRRGQIHEIEVALFLLPNDSKTGWESEDRPGTGIKMTRNTKGRQGNEAEISTVPDIRLIHPDGRYDSGPKPGPGRQWPNERFYGSAL